MRYWQRAGGDPAAVSDGAVAVPAREGGEAEDVWRGTLQAQGNADELDRPVHAHRQALTLRSCGAQGLSGDSDGLQNQAQCRSFFSGCLLATLDCGADSIASGPQILGRLLPKLNPKTAGAAKAAADRNRARAIRSKVAALTASGHIYI